MSQAEVNRPVSPGIRTPNETHDQFFFYADENYRQLGVCYYGAACLTRGRFCNLQLLLDLASAVFLWS
jgi:hypothetical protein